MIPSRSVVLLAGLVAAGCTFDPSGLPPEQAITADPLLPSNGASLEHLEDVSAPLRVPVEGGVVLDTDTGEILLADETVVRQAGEGVRDGIGFHLLDNGVSLVAVTELDIGADGILVPIGFRPILFLSKGDARIRGILDVSAPCDGVSLECGGPGGGDGALRQGEMSTGCAPGRNGNGRMSGGSRTGGGGGAFRTDGAPGGEAGDSQPGGAGGSLSAGNCPGLSLEPLRGGSAGGAGAAAEAGGVGGGGGGAVQITSLTRIEVAGQASDLFLGIFANGAGGGAAEDGGGGGGGAGGAILLEAPEITLRNVFVTANGGGGGGGGDPQSGAVDGDNGTIGTEAASGGNGDFAGGTGGTGTEPPTAGQGGGVSTGGGGGSAGIIRFHVPSERLIREGVVISPEAVIADPRWAGDGE